MKLYPDSSESCGYNPGKHLYVYTKPDNAWCLWKRVRVPASCRAQPQTGTAGQLNYSSGQFCKKLVLSLKEITSVFCAILTGIQQGRRGNHLLNYARSCFSCSSPMQVPIPGSCVLAGKGRLSLQPSEQHDKSCHKEKEGLLLVSMKFSCQFCVYNQIEKMLHVSLYSKMSTNSCESWFTDFKHEFLVSAAHRHLSGLLESSASCTYSKWFILTLPAQIQFTSVICVSVLCVCESKAPAVWGNKS